MKTLVVTMAIGTMVLGSLAYAAPRTMSLSDLDSVSAGQGLLSWILGDQTELTSPDAVLATEAEGDNSQAAGNKAIGAIADNGSTAINGDDNTAVQVWATINVPITDSFNTVTTTNDIDVDVDAEDEGAVAFIGDNNCVTTTVDESYVEVDADDFTGVVARNAQVSDSFNTKEIDIDVDVDIDDSFNEICTQNTLTISGQNYLQAIVNANTLGDQLIGVNLNVTTATAGTPEGTTVPSLGANGNALAINILTQNVINGSVVIFGLGVGLTDGNIPETF